MSGIKMALLYATRKLSVNMQRCSSQTHCLNYWCINRYIPTLIKDFSSAKQNDFQATDRVLNNAVNEPFLLRKERYQVVDFEIVYSALENYKAIHGNVLVRKDFIVPHDDSRYPKNTWGVHLGSKMKGIILKGNWPKHHEKLAALGVNFKVKHINKVRFGIVLSAFQSYKAIHGHLKVPFNFIVPNDDDRYPKNTWGMKLGHKLYGLRCKNTWSNHKQELIELGIDYTKQHQQVYGFDAIYSAFESFKAIHGHLNIPRDFVVPADDASYPENTWGMYLGHLVSNIRLKNYFSEHKQKLINLGVNYEKQCSRQQIEDDMLFWE